MPAGVLLAAAAAASLGTALVTADHAVLRAAARDSAPLQAQLRPGELLEVRGERLDHLQVWDHRRERGGFVRASQVRRLAGTPGEAPELLAVLRFVQDAPGREALGIGLAAAWLQAAPAEAVSGQAGIEVLAALGTMADRLAQRASAGAATSANAQAALAADLDLARHYGVRFASYEREGRMRVCYDGEAFRRVLAMAARPAQQADAALALTRADCLDPALPPLQLHEANRWRAELLDRVQVEALPGYVRNRVAMRRAEVWSTLAWEQARRGEPPHAAAQRAIAELASVQPAELPESDAPAWNDAVMRVNASRWAAVPAPVADKLSSRPSVQTVPGQPGETCVLLVDARHDAARPLARRCTFGVVWPQSASLNREGNALALAVQPVADWRELWLFRRSRGGWSVDLVPPAAVTPGLGYAEFAGWVPGGRQVLVAREARGEGRYRRRYEVLSLDGLAVQRQSRDAEALGPFQRWADPDWKRGTVSLR
ncbi:hypothetical protein [Ramlibacter sp.]|uniref:hypothetical protein n=1 Tax=Ramlibacter sp. TaxID=1917967 RepID=UPI002D3185D1|nr:hypothetical protein [Ramlibacter sp.]HYD75210.1 hypothetical protein [Ramlibacter sp.]